MKQYPTYKHGQSASGRKKRTKIYGVWISMRQRCNDKDNISYKYYGLKGIKVCKEWSDFRVFKKDMGDMPSEKHQVDRIDNDKGYYPKNCRWVTAKENMLNSTIIRWITHKGETKSLTQWAEDLNINIRTLKARLDIMKWPLEKALVSNKFKSPKGTNKRKDDPIYSKTYYAWSDIIKRCRNPIGKNSSYKGIKICKRWDSFENFIEDVGFSPSESSSFKRIKSNGDFTLENSRWI